MIWLSIALLIIICVIVFVIGDYKKAELEYKKFELENRKADNEITQRAMAEKVSLDIQKERTKQSLIEKEKEAERTEQLRIKSEYTEKYGKNLY